jgi:uncharacterized membrane protein
MTVYISEPLETTFEFLTNDIFILSLSMFTGVIFIFLTYINSAINSIQSSNRYIYSRNHYLIHKFFSSLFLTLIGMLLGFITGYLLIIIANTLPFDFKCFISLLIIILDSILFTFFIDNHHYEEIRENELELP